MDDVQKSRVRLNHWIDHNLDHLKGYDEVAHVLEHAKLARAAEKVRKGMQLIEEANAEFVKALAEISKEVGNSHHAHAGGEHPHEHAHGEEHCGEHPCSGHHHHGHGESET
jgi:hypothetical protein